LFSKFKTVKTVYSFEFLIAMIYLLCYLVQPSVAAKIPEETFCISRTGRASEMLPVWSLDHDVVEDFPRTEISDNDFLHL